jgi:hypothetical protein
MHFTTATILAIGANSAAIAGESLRTLKDYVRGPRNKHHVLMSSFENTKLNKSSASVLYICCCNQFH